MLNANQMHAIGQFIARQARAFAAESGAKANEVIDYTPLLKRWQPGVHAAGEVVVEDDYPYRTIQTHDSTYNPDWNPQAVPALFAPFHATDKAHALPWRAPTHAGDAYNAGEWIIWTDGAAYECLQDATVYDPEVLPSAWRKGE